MTLNRDNMDSKETKKQLNTRVERRIKASGQALFKQEIKMAMIEKKVRRHGSKINNHEEHSDNEDSCPTTLVSLVYQPT